jgi:hypothetical protein
MGRVVFRDRNISINALIVETQLAASRFSSCAERMFFGPRHWGLFHNRAVTKDLAGPKSSLRVA